MLLQNQKPNTQSVRIVDKLGMVYTIFISVDGSGEKGFHNFKFELSQKRRYTDDTRYYRYQHWIQEWKMV